MIPRFDGYGRDDYECISRRDRGMAGMANGMKFRMFRFFCGCV